MRACQPRDAKRRVTQHAGEREPFGSSFCMFSSPGPALSCFYMCFLPRGPPYGDWASRGCCLFCLRVSLRPSDLPLFYFHGLFPSLSFSHHCFGLLFPIVTTQQYQVQNFFDNLPSVFAWFNYFSFNNLCALLLTHLLNNLIPPIHERITKNSIFLTQFLYYLLSTLKYCH